MKILKRYTLELCFILSFALPFIKGANADNGRRFVEIYYGFTFFDGTCHCNSYLYLFALDCLATQKTVDETACCWKLCLFSPMDCYRGLFIPHVTRRFGTTLDKFGSSDKNVSVGLLSNILLGILLIIKYFKVKQS